MNLAELGSMWWGYGSDCLSPSVRRLWDRISSNRAVRCTLSVGASFREDASQRGSSAVTMGEVTAGSPEIVCRRMILTTYWPEDVRSTRVMAPPDPHPPRQLFAMYTAGSQRSGVYPLVELLADGGCALLTACKIFCVADTDGEASDLSPGRSCSGADGSMSVDSFTARLRFLYLCLCLRRASSWNLAKLFECTDAKRMCEESRE